MSDGTTKVCTGPAHPGPTALPITDEHWYFHKSGVRAGKPTSRCKLCINFNKLKDPSGQHGTIECKSVRPFLQELVRRCGNAEAAASLAGMSASSLRSALQDQQCRMQKATARRIITALAERRRLDRREGIVSETFRRALVVQAAREDKVNRLAGY